MNPFDLAGRWRDGHPTGYVYAVQAAAGDGPVKIGRTSNVVQRMTELQTGSPVPLRYIALLPGGQPHEHYIHRRLDDHREHGEWFAADPSTGLLGELHDGLEHCPAESLSTAWCEVLRSIDEEIADLERLWLNGATYRAMSGLTGLSVYRLQKRIESMRRLGFSLPHRNVYRARNREEREASHLIIRRRAGR